MRLLPLLLILGCNAASVSESSQVDAIAFQWTPPAVTFFSDFETAPLANWHSLEFTASRPMSDSFAFVTAPRRSGNASARIHVEQGWNGAGYQDRTMLMGDVGDIQGNDVYYGFSVLFPPDWQPLGTWDTFLEWHADFGTQAMISFLTVHGDIRVQISTGALSQFVCTQNPVACPVPAYHNEVVVAPDWAVGQWHDFIVHINWQFNVNGRVEVWHRIAGTGDFAQTASVLGIPTLQYYQVAFSAARLMAGYYRPSWCAYPVVYGCMPPDTSPYAGMVQPTSTLYLDNLVRARTYTAARQVFDDTAGVGLP